ncbi:dTDP-4-dehydrorhamnose 3,5-epimerase [Enterovirga aerilata]|uniref:dTDP-4-dehydrorhamnose 3,5-epimerase n=1 Tax=Enterovirga aerilata TaxID=2730920 RepID=A0A849IF00_9HYPH|nr:dTDP-4-dehydrorhamnose 3,5-epimerase [Enterovirga sp. DB1703]NNM74547.1 dTDP-4-dehydrorhamnose 3,5-epimerase [Enterovirga sp. DB1703]
MATVQLVKPRRFGDARGWFSETYSRRAYEALGIGPEFVQDNHSMSAAIGTLRGLHFQVPPHGQGKLVRCTAGAIMDYALDIRHGSPTYGRWLSAELTAENGYQLWVPVGFAHAFVTLAPNTEVIYKVTDYYAPECDSGVRWDSVGIEWPLPLGGPVLSDKDRALPTLAELESPFPYDGEPLPERLA